jgi:hypothetical protein
MVSRLGRLARFVLFGDTIHDSGCSLRVYKKEVVENLELIGKMHRYMVLLIRQKGYKIGEIPVQHHARTIGKSKYSAAKFWKGLLGLLKLRFGTDVFLIVLYASITVSFIVLIYSVCYL